MTICRVVGSVVSTSNADEIPGGTYLLVQNADPSGVPTGAPIIALDAVQAGVGDMVMVAQGSSCRQIPSTIDKAVDALIVGIIDIIDEGGTLRYSSSEHTP